MIIRIWSCVLLRVMINSYLKGVLLNKLYANYSSSSEYFLCQRYWCSEYQTLVYQDYVPGSNSQEISHSHNQTFLPQGHDQNRQYQEVCKMSA